MEEEEEEEEESHFRLYPLFPLCYPSSCTLPPLLSVFLPSVALFGKDYKIKELQNLARNNDKNLFSFRIARNDEYVNHSPFETLVLVFGKRDNVQEQGNIKRTSKRINI